MTKPSAETLQRERDHLWVTDAEMIRRLGVPEKTARVAIRMLERADPTFPRKEPLWATRRYWPAIRRWFDERYGGVAIEKPAYVPRHRVRPALERTIARVAEDERRAAKRQTVEDT